MSTRCIACKREISDKQKSCYICGSSQNYIAHFSQSLIVIAIFSIGAFWLSYNLFKSELETVEISQKESSKKANEQFALIQTGFESKITLLEKSKNETELEIEQLKASILLGTTNSSDVQNALEKEKSRSKWLGKENRRFSKKIKTLTLQIASLEGKTKISPPNKVENSIPIEMVEKLVPSLDNASSNNSSSDNSSSDNSSSDNSSSDNSSSESDNLIEENNSSESKNPIEDSTANKKDNI